MNIEDKLKSWNKKMISRSELECLLHVSSDAELYALTCGAVSSGLLAPVKRAGTNGNRSYPVWLKYRVTVQEDYSEVLSETAMLHPALLKTGYLQSKPELYVRYRKQLQQLSTYLFKRNDTVSVSKKERSFEIFDEEKQLDDRSFTGVLRNLELYPEILGYYETPEYCFNDYIPERKDHLTLLICENKDIWFNIRRRMFEDGARTLFDTPIDGVVYGCGNRISAKGALREYTRFMGTKDVQYLYWGDIDRAGLNIYLSLHGGSPELDIRLFVNAYEKMLHLVEKRELPDSRDHREQMGDYEGIYGMFSEKDRELLISLIKDNKRVPQEIITYETLWKTMR